MGCGVSKNSVLSTPLLNTTASPDSTNPVTNQIPVSDSSSPEAQQSANASSSHPSKKQSKSAPSSPFGIPENGNFRTEERFSIIKVLGEGASCKVVSVRDKQTQKCYAMKIMDKNENYNSVLFSTEQKILSLLNHPNILSYVDAYEDAKTYHLVTVLYTGGELFDRVKSGVFSEKMAANLTKQMLEAIAYCHRHNVVHRDLKPENFVFEDSSETSLMKLIDFGCAKLTSESQVIADVAGSPYYCAPEILHERFVRTGGVWKKSDMWSVGVIIYLLVCGYPPFNGNSQEKIFERIKRGRFSFPRAKDLGGWELSTGVKDLITSLLRMHPEKRMSAEEALKHPWVQGTDVSEEPISNYVINALNSFRNMCRLKKAAARVMQKRMTTEDKQKLMEIFTQFDSNGDGQLGPEEIASLMKHIGANNAVVTATTHSEFSEGTTEDKLNELSDDVNRKAGVAGSNTSARHVVQVSNIESFLSVMDQDGDGGVSLNEFETGIFIGKLNSKEEIRKSFEIFDANSDGFITQLEMEEICEFLTPEAAHDLIAEVDENGDGKITFDEWLKAMTGMSGMKELHVQQKGKTAKLMGRHTPSIAEAAEESSPKAHTAPSIPVASEQEVPKDIATPTTTVEENQTVSVSSSDTAQPLEGNIVQPEIVTTKPQTETEPLLNERNSTSQAENIPAISPEIVLTVIKPAEEEKESHDSITSPEAAENNNIIIEA